MHEPDAAERYLSPETVGRRLDVPSDSVRWWCRTGRLGCIRVGRLVRIPEGELRAFLARSTQAPAGERPSAGA